MFTISSALYGMDKKFPRDIFEAIKKHDYAALEYYLEKKQGNSIRGSIRIDVGKGWTTIGWALKCKNFPAFETLLQAGVNPNLAYFNKWRQDPQNQMHSKSIPTLAYVAKRLWDCKDREQILSLLDEHNVDIHFEQDAALLRATEAGRVTPIKSLLDKGATLTSDVMSRANSKAVRDLFTMHLAKTDQ